MANNLVDFVLMSITNKIIIIDPSFIEMYAEKGLLLVY